MTSMATPIQRAQSASTQGEALVKEPEQSPGWGSWQRWVLGSDGKFDLIGGGASDLGAAGGAIGGAVMDPLVNFLKGAFTSEFFKRLAAALVGMALIIIVLAKFAGEQAGVV